MACGSTNWETNQEYMILVKSFILDNVPRIESFFEYLINKKPEPVAPLGEKPKVSQLRSGLTKSLSHIPIRKHSESYLLRCKKKVFAYFVENKDLIFQEISPLIEVNPILHITHTRCMILVACSFPNEQYGMETFHATLDQERLAFTNLSYNGKDTWDGIYELIQTSVNLPSKSDVPVRFPRSPTKRRHTPEDLLLNPQPRQRNVFRRSGKFEPKNRRSVADVFKPFVETPDRRRASVDLRE